MSIEFDEKGKFFTDIVPKVATQVTVQTAAQQVRGSVHVREGERLKDELDRDEPFLAMTDATVLAADGQVSFQAVFLAVKRSQIVWVTPYPYASKGDAG
jgi:hypothetical protein